MIKKYSLFIFIVLLISYSCANKAYSPNLDVIETQDIINAINREISQNGFGRDIDNIDNPNNTYKVNVNKVTHNIQNKIIDIEVSMPSPEFLSQGNNSFIALNDYYVRDIANAIKNTTGKANQVLVKGGVLDTTLEGQSTVILDNAETENIATFNIMLTPEHPHSQVLEVDRVVFRIKSPTDKKWANPSRVLILEEDVVSVFETGTVLGSGDYSITITSKPYIELFEGSLAMRFITNFQPTLQQNEIDIKNAFDSYAASIDNLLNRNISDAKNLEVDKTYSSYILDGNGNGNTAIFNILLKVKDEEEHVYFYPQDSAKRLYIKIKAPSDKKWIEKEYQTAYIDLEGIKKYFDDIGPGGSERKPPLVLGEKYSVTVSQANWQASSGHYQKGEFNLLYNSFVGLTPRISNTKEALEEYIKQFNIILKPFNAEIEPYTGGTSWSPSHEEGERSTGTVTWGADKKQALFRLEIRGKTIGNTKYVFETTDKQDYAITLHIENTTDVNWSPGHKGWGGTGVPGKPTPGPLPPLDNTEYVEISILESKLNSISAANKLTLGNNYKVDIQDITDFTFDTTNKVYILDYDYADNNAYVALANDKRLPKDALAEYITSLNIFLNSINLEIEPASSITGWNNPNSQPTGQWRITGVNVLRATNVPDKEKQALFRFEVRGKRVGNTQYELREKRILQIHLRNLANNIKWAWNGNVNGFSWNPYHTDYCQCSMPNPNG